MASIKQYGERKDNISAIVSFIRSKGQATRIEVCKALSLSWTCISDLVALMIEEKILVESEYVSKNGESLSKGRRPSNLSLNKRKYFLGVDVNNSGISTTALSITGERIASKKWESKHFTTEEELTTAVCDKIEEALFDREDCCGIGIAMEGMRSDTGGFLYPMNGGSVLVSPMDAVSSHFGLPVSARHDPECIIYSVSSRRDESCMVIRVDNEEVGVAAMKDGKILEFPLELGQTYYGGRMLRDILQSCAAKGEYREIAEILGNSVGNLAFLLGIEKCFLVGDWIKWLGEVSVYFDTAFRTINTNICYEVVASLPDASDGAARLAMSEYPTVKSKMKVFSVP